MTPWTRPGWFQEARAWIHAELGHHGIVVQGPIEISRSMPWSAVLSVPTNDGQVYFKAVSPLDPHEPALHGALARWRPDCLPQLLSKLGARLDSDARWWSNAS